MPERRLFPRDLEREASTVLQTGISVMAFGWSLCTVCGLVSYSTPQRAPVIACQKTSQKMKFCGWPIFGYICLCQFGAIWNSYCNIWSNGSQPCLHVGNHQRYLQKQMPRPCTRNTPRMPFPLARCWWILSSNEVKIMFPEKGLYSLRSIKIIFKWEAMSLNSQPNWQEALSSLEN